MMFRIGYASDDLFEKAQSIADRYDFTIDQESTVPRLILTDEKLVLCIDAFAPLFVDFNGETLKRRTAAGKKQGLISACKPMRGMHIIDATAGWGRDSGLLASFGADVLMLERDGVMAALLEDALTRRAQSPNNGSLRLIHQDAKAYLKALAKSDYPDVIYIDPMHPLRQKSALVKKDMQALQRLIGPDEDACDLIEIAMAHVRQKVIVKWPERLQAALPPTRSIHGKTVRFDVYAPRL